MSERQAYHLRRDIIVLIRCIIIEISNAFVLNWQNQKLAALLQSVKAFIFITAGRYASAVYAA